MLDETDEARDLLERRPDVGIGGAHDIAPPSCRARAAAGSTGTELLEILETLVVRRPARATRCATSGRRCSTSWAARSSRCPSCGRGSSEHRPGRRAARLRPRPRSAACAARCASPTSGCAARLETLVHGSELVVAAPGAASSRCATAATSCRCAPTPRARSRASSTTSRAAARRCSSSRWSSVELGNAWREAQLEVQAEEERILDELSALVGGQADALDETLEALATFDFWLARARLAGELDGVRAGDVDSATTSSCCRRATRA